MFHLYTMKISLLISGLFVAANYVCLVVFEYARPRRQNNMVITYS